MSTEKKRENTRFPKLPCGCRCHRWSDKCFDHLDQTCGCQEPGKKLPGWESRLEPEEKAVLIQALSDQVKKIDDEFELKRWYKDLDIPEHIKEYFIDKIDVLILMSLNDFDDYYFVPRVWHEWTIKVLEAAL